VNKVKIIKTAVAGTMESSDIMLKIQPIDSQEIHIDLESSVEKQFGRQIRKVITDTLSHLNVTGVEVIAVDKGALDCTIKARTLTAVHRAAEMENYDWEEIDSWNN
jgi:citrate lyase subunit gamma (acyl carrier protein)